MSNQHEDHEPDELSPSQQAAIERSLAAVAPVPPRLDRDRLMFLAGAASVLETTPVPSGRREPPGGVGMSFDNGAELVNPAGKLTLPARLAWPAATAALAVTSLALAIALFVRPAPAERIIYLPQPASFAAASPAPSLDHRPVQEIVATTISRSPKRDVPSHNYLHTRDVALRLGLDALGSLPGGGDAGSPPPTYRSLLDALSPPPRAASVAPESSQM